MNPMIFIVEPHLGQDNGCVQRPNRPSPSLDFNGYPTEPTGSAQEIKLQPPTLYYLIADITPPR